MVNELDARGHDLHALLEKVTAAARDSWCLTYGGWGCVAWDDVSWIHQLGGLPREAPIFQPAMFVYHFGYLKSPVSGLPRLGHPSGTAQVPMHRFG